MSIKVQVAFGKEGQDKYRWGVLELAEYDYWRRSGIH